MSKQQHTTPANQENEGHFDLVCCGVGGQGIVLLSNAIGQACLAADIKAHTGELHGLSQRSGSVYIHLRIGSSKRSPIIPYAEADAIVAMEAMEALRYIEYLKPEGIVIMSNQVVHPPIEVATLSREKSTEFITVDAITEQLDEWPATLAPIDALTLAAQAGNTRTINAVFLGALGALARFPVGPEALKRGLEAVVPPKAIDANRAAFDLGRKAAYDTLCDAVECREP